MLLTSVLLVVSCDKEKEQDENPSPNIETKGEFKLEFDHVWGPAQANFSLNQTLVHPSTLDTISFNKLMYYISNIKLNGKDGSTWAETESYHIVDASNAAKSILTIKDVPSKEYIGITFSIGVDSIRNVSGAQEGALSPSNGMFWSWNTGYIFIKAEGTSPQSNNGTFEYHIGGFKGDFNAYKTNVLDFKGEILTIAPNASPQVHLTVNAARLWHGGLKIADISRIHMPNANSLQMAGNFQGAFAYDHIHN